MTITKPPSPESKELLALLEVKEQRQRYRRDPLAYMTERLGVPASHIRWSMNAGYEGHEWDGTPDPLHEILTGLANSEWVGVSSAAGVGKTYLAACIIYWFLECYPGSLVVTTAPKEKQLELHVWKELGRLREKFGLGELTSLKLRMTPPKDDWIAVGFVAGVKASEANQSATKAQGFHAEHMLIIFEETPGIHESVINAFQNTSTAPHNLILALGNPDHKLDNLAKFCNQDRVRKIRISAKDHPNVVCKDANIIPGAISEIGLERLLSRFKDINNPLYLSRARGIAPAQSKTSVIQLEWLIDASRNDPDMFATGFKALGVDVANSEDGDKAAIAKGKGRTLIEVVDFPCPDANQLGHHVFQTMRDEIIMPENVGIDSVGVGAGTVNTLKEHGRRVNALNGGAKPEENWTFREDGEKVETFVNLRSQMIWAFRLDVQNGTLSLPYDEELFADLVTPEWGIRNGKIYIESKDEIKKRLGRSPNKGDAAIYWNWVRRKRGTAPAMKSEPEHGGKKQTERTAGNAYHSQRRRSF
jgi:hypothetical protein